jgi:hypothetical protein
VDNILKSMSTHIATLRELNKNKSGVVPNCAIKLNDRWEKCAGMPIIQLEEGGDKFMVTRTQDTGNQVAHVVNIDDRFCSRGMWQEYGMPCVDALACYCKIEKISLLEVMESDCISEFHRYSYYHQLMKKNINPVIIENLEPVSDMICSPPDIVAKRAGRPTTKLLRLGRSKFKTPEESTIICSICNKRGHNKRTCLARSNAITDDCVNNPFGSAFESIQLPPPDLL